METKVFSIQRKQCSIPGAESINECFTYIIITFITRSTEIKRFFSSSWKNLFFFFQSSPLLSRSKGRKKLINFNSNFKRKRLIEFTIKAARYLIGEWDFSPLFSPFLYIRGTLNRRYLSRIHLHTYIYTEEKENFTPQSDLIRKRYAQMQILGVGEKSYRIRRMMNSCNRERERESR